MQHHYLAFVTLAFATLVFLVLRNEEWLTKGVYGISGIPRPTVLGWSTKEPIDYYYFCLGILALVSAAAVVADPLAVGPRVHGAAREPDARRARSASTRGATR